MKWLKKELPLDLSREELLKLNNKELLDFLTDKREVILWQMGNRIITILAERTEQRLNNLERKNEMDKN